MPEVIGELVLSGEVVCPGIGIGRVCLLEPAPVFEKGQIGPEEVLSEQQRYTSAVELARHHLREHIRAIHDDTPQHAQVIVEVHKAMFRDEAFHDAVRKRIASDLKNAEWALEEEGCVLMSQFEMMRDPFIQARVEDVRDMVTSIMKALVHPGQNTARECGRHPENVLVSAHLHPSAALLAQRSGAAGFVTTSQAISSHAAILLKGSGIPSVAGVARLMDEAHDGDRIVVDGHDGLAILRPEPWTIERYREEKRCFSIVNEVREPRGCRTADGVPVELLGNVGNPDQADLVLQKGLEGIGLFRTEFMALERNQVPTEDEQVEIYAQIIRKMEGRRVVIRTFDLGADKEVAGIYAYSGRNPAMGLRGIRRHLLREREELQQQLRAILRAATDGNVGVMIPMVTTVADVVAARKALSKAREDLLRWGLPCGENVRFGVMIETPAAALVIHRILPEVDFVSLGTNDLLQYTMAADRDNEDVVPYSDPDSEAFLWLLEFVINEASDALRAHDVTVCGEVASRKHMVPKLIKMGYLSFSVSPVMADEIRDVIASTEQG
ncbi:MAG: phosphoenolpyruvate--protein phosphotransferase [Kiritimatiellae bacterium]|nr:phosphoenolpyruvate--protein phosphotransferase [Kiritimatiellia bacterium]